MSLKVPPVQVSPARFRPDRLTLLMIAIAALGTALLLGRELALGVMLSPDTAHYTGAARSLLSGEGLLEISGRPYTKWPPLYPMLLALASLGLFDPVAVAGPLNAIFFGLTVFIVGRYLRHCLESRFLAAWGCLATALAPPLLTWSSSALTEPLFILLVTLALTRTDRFLTEGGTRTLLWAAVFSALAWQARYIGVAVPACVGLLLLFHPRAGASMARRMRRVTAYSLIVAVPMALWLLRNLLYTGEFITNPPAEDYPVPITLRDAVRALWSWMQTGRCGFLGLPWWPLFDRVVIALLAAIAALLVPVGCILIGEQCKRRTVARWHPVWLFGGFALTYSVLLVSSTSFLVGVYVAYGTPLRYLSVLYVPVLIAGVFVLDRILGYERQRRLLGDIGSLPIVRTMMPGKDAGKKGSVLVAIVTIVLFLGVVRLAVPAVSTIMDGNCPHLYLGFNGPRWAGSEVLRYVRANPVAGEIYSNAPHPLSLHSGGGGGKNVTRYLHLQNRYTALERQFAETVPDGAQVIWFDQWRDGDHDYGEADLWLLPGLEPVAELADGVVFKVNRGGASSLFPPQNPSRSPHATDSRHPP